MGKKLYLEEQKVKFVDKRYRLNLGQWEVDCLNDVLRINEGLVEQGKEYLFHWQHAWIEAHPDEETWVRKEHGLPSLLVRFDTTVNNGQLKPYEIEERPAGVGLALKLNSQFGVNLQRVVNTWPNYKVVLSSKRSEGGTDDSYWREVVGLSTAQQNEYLVLVRADPDEKEFDSLSRRSVSTISKKGDKKYGVQMGLWKEVQLEDQLPTDRAFVLKPKVGSKASGVKVLIPGVSQEEIIRTAFDANPNGLYLQDYYPPMSSELLNYPNMIYRVFYGYNLQSREWEFLGGFWNASSHFIVDGGKDTIYGPVIKNY